MLHVACLMRRVMQNLALMNAPAMNAQTQPLSSMTISAFMDALAAAAPVPGGGAVAGVTLAQANALGAMVVGYAIGKAKFAAHDACHRATHEHFELARHEALRLADADAAAYAKLNALWKLAKDDPARGGFLDAVRSAIAPAESTAQAALATLNALALLVGTTSISLASDLRIAIDLAAASARAAQENVRINLPSIADESERANIRARTESLLHEAQTLANELQARLATNA
jgi:methenyltetrahydrofolate cyclohydrolase